MAVSKNTYRGMNQDMSKTTHAPDFYFEGRNIRNVTEDGLSTTAVENEKGNVLVNNIPATRVLTAVYEPDGTVYLAGNIRITLSTGDILSTLDFTEPASGTTEDFFIAYKAFILSDPVFDDITPYVTNTGMILYSNVSGLEVLDVSSIPTRYTKRGEKSKIIGEGRIRRENYLFTASEDAYDESNRGYVWRFDYDQATDGTFISSSLNCVFSGIVGFSAEFPIGDEVEGRFESPEIKKLYWVDGKHQLRFLNVAEDNEGLDPDIINVLPKSVSEPIVVTSITDSGSIKAGIVQYGYQLINSQGGSSSISPLSNPAYIVESSQSGSTTDYFGAPVGTDTGKAAAISLTDIEEGFDYVSIYRIFYSDEFNNPLIDLITQQLISEDRTVDFVDNGSQTLGALTTGQFSGLVGNYFIPQTLASKDNRLFTANHEEEIFDIGFDARAYRFSNVGIGYSINEGSGGRVTALNWGSIEESADVYNPSNDARSEGVYEFQTNGITLGGQGPNISYTFETENVIIDNHANDTHTIYHPKQRSFGVNSVKSAKFADGIQAKASVGYKRGEIYRFGLKFTNTKGQSSFVSWIGDIRFPTTADGFPVTGMSPTPEEDVLARNLYLNFNINLASLTQDQRDEIAYVEIVRAERKDSDKTILAQGIVNPTFDFGGPDGIQETRIMPVVATTYEMATQSIEGLDAGSYEFVQGAGQKTISEFISPDQIFNDSISYNAGDFLRYETLSNWVTRSMGSPDDFGLNSPVEPYRNKIEAVNYLGRQDGLTTDNNRWVVSKSRNSEVRVNKVAAQVQIDILDATSANGTKGLINEVGGVTIHNKVDFPPESILDGNLGGGKQGRGNSKLYIQTSEKVDALEWLNFTTAQDILEHGFILANYKRPLAAQYGGYDYAARQNTVYITTHSRAYLGGASSANLKVKGGDTFISYFDYLRVSIVDDQNSVIRKWQEVLFFPVETSINLNLRHDKSWNYLADKSGVAAYPALQESLAFAQQQPSYSNVADEDFIDNELDTEQTDLYLYNETYSRPDKIFSYFPKPQVVNFTSKFDTQTRYSLIKINNEILDNWSQFLTSNQNQVDSKYGGITKLINYSDELMYIQPEGYGRWSVNPRVQTTASDGEPIELGTGGVLHEYKYISTKFGTNQKFGIISSQLNMYFIDNKTFKLVKTGQGTGNISDMQGISSTLRNLVTKELLELSNPYLDNGIRVAYDRRFNEILFTLRQSNGEYETIAFNELANTFTSFYGYQPPLYFEDAENMFSSDDRSKVYLHHYGERGVYYDRPAEESSVTLILNDKADFTKRFDNIEYYSQIFENNIELFEETVTSIRFYNDYQDTGTIPLTNRQNIRRRMRKWRLKIFRDQVDGKARMRNPYLFVTLSFDNNNNKKLVLHHLLTYYDIKPY